MINHVLSKSIFSSVHSLARNWRFFVPFKTKIGYIGCLGKNNLGDAAMFLAIRKLFSSLNVLPFKETKLLKAYQQITKSNIYDAIFLGGGTLIGKGYLDIFKEAKSNHKGKVIFGSGVRNPDFWERVGVDNRLMEWKELLEACNFVGVRGPLSQKILKDHGFHSAEVIGDPALNFARDKIKRKIRNKVLGINIGISNGFVWGNEKEILNKVIKLSRVLISKGWKLKFLPVWDQDVPYIEEAVKKIGSKAEIFDSWKSIDRTLDFLEQCDLFIGEKLHSVILATCVYTPPIMLEYRPKCLDFMMSMELQEFNIRTDRLSIDPIIDLMERLYEKAEYYQNKIALKVNHYKQIQEETRDVLTKHILNNSNCKIIKENSFNKKCTGHNKSNFRSIGETI